MKSVLVPIAVLAIVLVISLGVRGNGSEQDSPAAELQLRGLKIENMRLAARVTSSSSTLVRGVLVITYISTPPLIITTAFTIDQGGAWNISHQLDRDVGRCQFYRVELFEGVDGSTALQLRDTVLMERPYRGAGGK